MIVARDSRTLRHQVPGWNRSSATMHPPARIIAIVEQAMAFMCTIGSGVISRSLPGCTVHIPPIRLYHSPASR